jgi:hypothetical protein
MAAKAPRRVLLHYHFFKNAGTSVEVMLRQSLGVRWQSWDKADGGAKISADEMLAWLKEHPDVLAVSSHQVVPPLPAARGLLVAPIVFLRHPLDRAWSAWLFEWGHQKGAKEPVGPFEDYVAQKLTHKRASVIEDFQAMLLANARPDNPWPDRSAPDGQVLAAAKACLRSLPAFGLVERYADSMAWLRDAYGEAFPEVRFDVHHANAQQQGGSSLAQRLAALRERVAPATLDLLTRRNQLDLHLYEYACGQFDAFRGPADD